MMATPCLKKTSKTYLYKNNLKSHFKFSVSNYTKPVAK